ncbi:MAG: hypothetical protein IIV16_04665 [Alistipes sp.]|nr:hypothetical protein [Alistipes sp.]
MQLIFILSIVCLVGAVWFVSWWHRTYRKSLIIHQLRENIGHIGVSAIVSYPKTLAPLVALLEEEYPRSEAIFVADLQEEGTLLSELVLRYRLIKVNNQHLADTRALYRSRHRAYRRVVVVDLPIAHKERAFAIGKEVASYDNVLYLQGESIVERDAITYCANIVASQPSSSGVQLRSIVGADAYLERGDISGATTSLRLRTDCPLAWQKQVRVFALLAILVPPVMILLGNLLESGLMIASAMVQIVVTLLFLYVSCCVVTEKSLFARLDTVLRSFYRFWVERIATIRVSRTHDTPHLPFRVRVRNRPARYREGSRPRQ